ncbi:MAG: protein phosphatase 2C domain-containing protein [Ectobacillus sp.]
MRVISLQEREMPIHTVEKQHFLCRYTYRRARETQAENDIGQDYFSFFIENQSIMFAVCDGVSLSFCGDVAARFLGERLVDWLQALRAEREAHMLQESLFQYLQDLTREGTAAVNQHPLPDFVTGLLREVLEEKRKHGSETMYVCGRIDVEGEQVKLVLAYQGDLRIRLFGSGSEQTYLLGDTLHTSERWSSKQGCVGGKPTVFVRQWHISEAINRVAIYSDGLALLDNYIHMPHEAELEQLVQKSQQAPTSDDVCLLDIFVREGR